MKEIYLIGCIIAFFCGIYQAMEEHKNEKDISDFPVAIAYITFFSWIYVVYFAINKFKRINNEKDLQSQD